MVATTQEYNGYAHLAQAPIVPQFQFKRYTGPYRAGVGAMADNTATLRWRKDFIILSRNLHSEIGSPSQVELFYDAANNLIGIAPAADRSVCSVKATLNGGGKASWMVAASGFMKAFDISVDQNTTYAANVVHGMVVIYLGQPVH